MPAKKENIENTNIETETKNTKQEIDIQKMIQQAVADAVAQTSKIYEDKIKDLESRVETKQSENVIKENEIINKEISIKGDKTVWIQHMGLGSASFKRGRVSVVFTKLFDRRRIKWDILDEMFYEFREWFDNFEIVILDQEVREFYGIEQDYQERGCDEIKFKKLLESNNNSHIIDELRKLRFIPAMSFLKYYLDEYTKGTANCFTNNKFKELSEYYLSEYSINLTETLNEINVEIK